MSGLIVTGSQSASIEWVNFDTAGPSRTRQPSLPSSSASVTIPVITTPPLETNVRPQSLTRQRTGRYRPHKFFDNPPSPQPSGTSTPKSGVCPTSLASALQSSNPPTPPATQNGLSRETSLDLHAVKELEVEPTSRIAFAHFGYIYALTTVIRPNGGCWLVSGSGGSDIKIWKILPRGDLQLIRSFTDLAGAVFSLCIRDSLLYAGLQDGEIDVWDLETGSCIRSIHAHEADVLSMVVLGDDVYTAAGDGRVLRVNETFDCTAAFKAHSGIVASSIVVEGEGASWDLITAGDDSYVKVCLSPLLLECFH